MKNSRALTMLTVVMTLGALIVLSNLIAPRSPAERQPIAVVTATWTMADVGTALHTITLENIGKHRRHDVALSITYRAKTGTVLTTHSKTVYEFIDPGTTITVKVADYAPAEATTAAVIVEGSEA